MGTEPRSRHSAEAVPGPRGLGGAGSGPRASGAPRLSGWGADPAARAARSPPALRPQPLAFRGSRPSSAETEVAHPRAGGARPRAGRARGARRGGRGEARPTPRHLAPRSGPVLPGLGHQGAPGPRAAAPALPGPPRPSTAEPVEPGGAEPEEPGGAAPEGPGRPSRRRPLRPAGGARQLPEGKQRGRRTPSRGKRPRPQSPGLDPPRPSLEEPGPLGLTCSLGRAPGGQRQLWLLKQAEGWLEGQGWAPEFRGGCTRFGKREELRDSGDPASGATRLEQGRPAGISPSLPLCIPCARRESPSGSHDPLQGLGNQRRGR